MIIVIGYYISVDLNVPAKQYASLSFDASTIANELLGTFEPATSAGGGPSPLSKPGAARNASAAITGSQHAWWHALLAVSL